ncbi:3-phosphoshikimate 1-carboxyvinyltransferase [Candidatus Woesearchaeota archaeon]|nr:3-phosphoshikimate 1-carboxyvinyltransferase [Candidatus Woesearchaeota archaeon]
MKKIEIIPSEIRETVVDVPGSKSYSNRALIIGSLTKGKTILKNFLFSEDTNYLIDALKKFNVEIEKKKGLVIIRSDPEKLRWPLEELYLGGSGTGIRLLTSFSALVSGKGVLSGNKRLNQRPIQELLNGLTELGVKAESLNNTNPPVRIIGDTLTGGECSLKGNISSQFFTSIMLAAPYAKEDVVINVAGELASRPYIDITIDIMKSFGVSVKNYNYEKFKIKAGQRYEPGEYVIEGDYSSASYFFGLAAINDSKITVKNLRSDSVQGDMGFVDVLEKMGCFVSKKKDKVAIKGTARLKPVKADMNTMPDAVLSLAAAAAFAKGKTIIENIGNLRIKESDRIFSVSNELKKLNIKIEEYKDKLVIYGGDPTGNAQIDTYNDHRIAMAFAIVGTKIPGIVIENPGCVSKSFPEFWEKLKETGVNIKNV